MSTAWIGHYSRNTPIDARRMDAPRLPLRTVYGIAIVLGLLGGLIVLVQFAEVVASLQERLSRWPDWLAWGVIGAAALLVLLAGVLLFRLLRPAQLRAAPAPKADRSSLEQRLHALQQAESAAATNPAALAPLQEELRELDQRAEDPRLQLAVFGEISTGKSRLIEALSGARLDSAVIGGSTQTVSRHGSADGRSLYADVPGVGEVDGGARAVLAREEALRAHLVLYLVDGDLSREQGAELAWLRQFDKPMLLVLNKADRYTPTEQAALLARLSARTGLACVAAVAGGEEEVDVVHADGRRERRRRTRPAQVEAVRSAIAELAGQPREALEQGRERAVLRAVDARLTAVERKAQRARGQDTVNRYTRRAMVGAVASVAPGTDLIIQSALALAMLRDLCACFGVHWREIEGEALFAATRDRLKTGTTLALGIAGNAAKAFPGFGTLGGGALHAVAYGLLFHTLGTAVVATLAERGSLSRGALLARLDQELAADSLTRRALALWQEHRDALR